jgi:hypothetical protein
MSNISGSWFHASARTTMNKKPTRCRFYSLLSSLMHGTMNLKFINAKQAKEVYEYKNTKHKLHKTTAAIWFNETFREKGIKVHLVGFLFIVAI